MLGNEGHKAAAVGKESGKRQSVAERRAEVLRLSKEGKRTKEIATALGVNRDAVDWDLSCLRSTGALPPATPRVVVRPLTEAELDAVEAAMKAGLTKRQMMEAYGFSRAALAQAHEALAKAGRVGAPRRVRVHGKSLNVMELAALRDAGWTYKRLAKHFGCSFSPIFNALLKAEERGVIKPKRSADDALRGPELAEREARIVAAWNAGGTQAAIAKAEGISRERARAVLDKARERGQEVRLPRRPPKAS